MKKDSVIIRVAEKIANSSVKNGVLNWDISVVDPQYPLSGLQRLRELAKRFKFSIHYEYGDYAYEYSHNRYYPTAAFKKFCKRFIKERS